MLKLVKPFFFKNLSQYLKKTKKQKNKIKILKYQAIKHFYLVLKGKMRAYTLTKPTLLVHIVSILSTNTSVKINKFLKQFFFFKVNDITNRVTTIFSQSSNL